MAAELPNDNGNKEEKEERQEPVIPFLSRQPARAALRVIRGEGGKAKGTLEEMAGKDSQIKDLTVFCQQRGISLEPVLVRVSLLRCGEMDPTSFLDEFLKYVRYIQTSLNYKEKGNVTALQVTDMRRAANDFIGKIPHDGEAKAIWQLEILKRKVELMLRERSE
jgi:hypothetical protein